VVAHLFGGFGLLALLALLRLELGRGRNRRSAWRATSAATCCG
jgi:hypothetical protein